MEIVGHYHDKEALILLPESVNRVSPGDRKNKREVLTLRQSWSLCEGMSYFARSQVYKVR